MVGDQHPAFFHFQSRARAYPSSDVFAALPEAATRAGVFQSRARAYPSSDDIVDGDEYNSRQLSIPRSGLSIF